MILFEKNRYAAYKTAQLWTAYGLPTYSYLFTRVGPYYFEYSSKTAGNFLEYKIFLKIESG